MNPEIYVVGDLHGNTEAAIAHVKRAADLNMKKVIQLGDFGLWDHTDKGVSYLDRLNLVCMTYGVKVYFVDGNHENHDRLAWYDANNPQTRMGHVYIRTHILHAPRGLKWHWEGRSLMSVGGAYSIDKAWRKPGISWWAGEELTDQQVGRLTEQADFLFTHDCPTTAPFRHRLKPDLDSHIHRQRMNEVGRRVQPKIWMHGHMHERYDYQFNHQSGVARVLGLEIEGDTWAWGVLNLQRASFEWGAAYMQGVSHAGK